RRCLPTLEPPPSGRLHFCPASLKVAPLTGMVGRPKEFDRDAVLVRARDVFWAKGYDGTSLDDLTEAMGLGRASLYNEFGDKHSLFIQALDRYRRERFAQITEALESASSARAGIEAVFRGTVKSLWADCDRRGCLLVNSIA